MLMGTAKRCRKGSGWQRGIKVALAVFVFCAGFITAYPVRAAEEYKIGYVSIAKLFDEYERTKRSESVLERKGKQKETELEKRLAELKKLRDGLELLSDEARQARGREINAKADELRRVGAYTQQDLIRERDKVAKGILTQIQKEVEDYAQKNGYSLILDERLLLYGQEVYDVTDEVLKALNTKDAARR